MLVEGLYNLERISTSIICTLTQNSIQANLYFIKIVISVNHVAKLIILEILASMTFSLFFSTVFLLGPCCVAGFLGGMSDD